MSQRVIEFFAMLGFGATLVGALVSLVWFADFVQRVRALEARDEKRHKELIELKSLVTSCICARDKPVQ
jgi:hypothetical protein